MAQRHTCTPHYFKWVFKFLICFSEPRQKVPAFKLKIQSPIKDKSWRTLFEFDSDGTAKSFVGNTMKLLEENPYELKVKNYIDLESSLVYVKEDGVFLLIFAKSPRKGKQELGKTFFFFFRALAPMPTPSRKRRRRSKIWRRKWMICVVSHLSFDYLNLLLFHSLFSSSL